MSTGAWRPPESERRLGLERYATDSPGVPGTVKSEPGDFRVSELSLYPMPAEDGPFTVLRVVSQNWEQHELSDRLAHRLGLPPHSIRWAGTKDRRAVADRLASYRGAPPSGAIDLPDARIVEAYRAREGLVLGHHFGNAFEIRLRGVTGPRAPEEVAEVVSELRRHGGIPNWFGPQRFGEVRPVTHDVGRRIVQGDLAGAVDCYLTSVVADSDERGAQARRDFADHHDAARALREFPPQYRFERQLLDHLARGHTAERALRALSRELRTLFVHAFQSLLFNRYLSRRAESGIAFDSPLVGDTILRVARDGTVPGNLPVPVTGDNASECATLVLDARALVAGPLVGFATPPSSGAAGEILEAVLAEERVTRAQFSVPPSPDLASAGTFRPLLVPLPPIGVAWDGEPNDPPTSVLLRFALPKGSYATILLRELLKVGATPSTAAHSTRAY